MGHLIGDQLLIETGARLKDCVRPEDTIARIGGDEFTILLDDIEDISETTHIAERIQTRPSSPLLSYLHHFPINILKIDQSFVSRMIEVGEGMAIVKTFITLAKSLGMSIIAEGIESVQQKLILQRLRCESGQGNFFSAPFIRW